MKRQAVDCGDSSRSAVLVADADDAFRVLVSSAFGWAGFGVHEAACGVEALATARAERPAAVVLDVQLPQLCGYEICRMLREEIGLAMPIVLVSGERTEPHDRVAGLLIGADDYVAKPCHPGELVARVRSCLRRAAPPVERVRGLTARELDVLRLLAAAREHHEIASALVISPKTVGTHLESIFRKLGVHSSAQAVAVAYRDGLVALPER